ncbi:MAG: IclR family transcriptional regulator [Rhizobiaceae bacterium]|nr:IclR family transcriptional regulator [Rhizobiaceae bacterium]
MSGAGGSGERLLAILDIFSEERLEWTPEEMQAELGYSRPTLYRYLKRLREAGFITSLPGRGFTLGPRVVELDFLMRKSDPLVSNGEKHLHFLAGRYPCSAFLVRWYGNRLLCVSSACSVPNPKSSYPRGRPMPLARGAISRAILANLPRRQQAPLIEANLTDFTEIGLGSTVDEVIESLRKTRRDGYSMAFGEVTPGVVGTAAPIFDAGRSPIAVLCVTVAETDIAPGRLPHIARDVTGAADAISNSLAERRYDGSEWTPQDIETGSEVLTAHGVNA